ncbi:ankyrin repeat-containing protein ITN1-like [Neltuma alba]|uniref:ankyrin repeat-containing protein ITN1-like n=1 Tax=Neltuma alba TaxID=207710 RepID=UPI0010A4466F|nr:ankyrin repeat-containing protein ITN1-like [Prosopis alba]
MMRIESLWKDKRKHQLAKSLAEFLVKHDFSWQISSSSRPTDDLQVQLPPVLYNVEKRKQQLERKEQKEDDQSKPQHYRTPLFVAASTGIEEIVELFLKEHPMSINYMGKEGHNILQIAVRHRQLKIFKLLRKNPLFSSLGYRISVANCTALHEVARMNYYRGSSQPGAAFKLQDELKWYRRVEKVVPSHLHLHSDNQLLTAKDVLEMEHHDMLEQARQWIKQTAESCSTVAVLVATVVFAAAYTIPGGSEAGTPVLLSSPIFIFFTVMDVVALAFSLASVVMFLSIITSPFELWNFHKSLPRKLNTGFTFLFLALTSTMLAFSATILLTIKLLWKKWTSTLVYSAAFFPVTIFGLIEFPLYSKIPILIHKEQERDTTNGVNNLIWMQIKEGEACGEEAICRRDSATWPEQLGPHAGSSGFLTFPPSDRPPFAV